MAAVLDNLAVNTSDGADEALAPGTTLLNAQYQIERYLSAGGFGITYLAKDSLRRPVVIKECFPEAVCSRKQKTVCARTRAHQGDFRSFVSLFVREAHSLSKLRHPNVVGVHQVFEDNETAYMALDLVDGQDLLSIIENPDRQLSPGDIQKVLLKVLDAVALIHSQDMLHRDISPDNILIDKNGSPILIDFGAAREEASKKSRALSSVLVVKDGYSPQEFYFGGSRQGPFSDIYALGATFYHLISGDPPPQSQNRLAEIAGKNPDPCKPLKGRFDHFDPSFLMAIDDAMSVFPKDRIQSAPDWTARILENRGAPQSVGHQRDNAATIKALLENQTNPEAVVVARDAASPIDLSPSPRSSVFSLNFDDINRYRRPKLFHLRDTVPTSAGIIRNQPRRLAAAFVLVAVSMLAAGVTNDATASVQLADIQQHFEHLFSSTLARVSQVSKGFL